MNIFSAVLESQNPEKNGIYFYTGMYLISPFSFDRFVRVNYIYNGMISHTLCDVLHSSVNPALFDLYGSSDDGVEESWYIGGKLHRLDGPAIISFNYVRWFIRDKLHREDGPAIIHGNNRIWEKRNSSPNDDYLTELDINDWFGEQWRMKGELHRNDGPADIGRKEYAQNAVVGGTVGIWYLHGKLHRVDGPAISGEYKDAWYFNGKLHRSQNSPEDGPAYSEQRIKKWYLHGKLHRTDARGRCTLPAVINIDNTASWYINDVKIRDGFYAFNADKL